MISPYTSPAAEIRATRERKNITAADLARIVGCEPPANFHIHIHNPGVTQ